MISGSAARIFKAVEADGGGWTADADGAAGVDGRELRQFCRISEQYQRAKGDS